MEIINNIKNFTNCINCLNKIDTTGRLLTKDNKTSISVFNGTIFISCLIPELKEKYDNNIDLITLKKLCNTIKDGNKFMLKIKDDIIEAKIIRTKSEGKYMFPNITDNDDNEQNDKAFQKASTIEPQNEVHTTTEWIIEQIDSLIFREIDKTTQKVVMYLKEKVFMLLDDNKTKGTSTISLLNFDEYKIKFKNECKVKINYTLIKDILPILMKISEKIMLKLDTDYPLKMILYDEGYKVNIIVAPMIENEN